ncbi:potassium channel subfamily K member 13-like [Clytia hemisphaerica]|uniref:Potassium channel domain-containing protein n=1 Tax=Clytia hemisphaerica TaxID=252671 RepID=A0A7M5XFX7_9CNID|eukprot:TCONS_00028797-protein
MGSIKSSCVKLSIRTAIFLVYLFAGAGIFLLLEKDDQQLVRTKADNDLTEHINSMVVKYNVSDADIKLFRNLMERALDVGALGRRKYKTEWNFVNALFFCGNVITTIGYGHITPHTIGGRVVMMFYALFGISLTGFFLRTVGNELTNFIAYLVKTYERRMMNREAEKLEIKCAVVSSILVLVMLLLGGSVFSVAEGSWSFLDAFYFCFVSLTTVGFGDMIPGESRDNQGHVEELFIELTCLIYYVVGLSIMSGVIVSISGIIEEKTKKLDIGDPMDAIRNLRIENLNSKAMKKLGYKVDEGVRMPPKMMKSSVNTQRRGTIIPDEDERVNRSRASLQQFANGGIMNTNNNNINSSMKSIRSGLSNTFKNENEINLPDTHTVDDEIHINKNTDQKILQNLQSPVSSTPTQKTSLQSLIETDENSLNDENHEKIEMKEERLEAGLYHENKNESSENGVCAFEAEPLDLNKNSTNAKRYTYTKDRLFTLKENNCSQENTVRTNSLSDMKLGIHRKISNERTKPKRLRKHSSLKDFKIQYSSNLQSVKRDKKKTQAEGKRVGLPAELFANDVSFVTKNQQNTSSPKLKPPKSDINGSFYSIPIASPIPSYTNPYFQSDDLIFSSPLIPSTASSLDLSKNNRTEKCLTIQRPSTGNNNT